MDNNDTHDHAPSLSTRKPWPPTVTQMMLTHWRTRLTEVERLIEEELQSDTQVRLDMLAQEAARIADYIAVLTSNYERRCMPA